MNLTITVTFGTRKVKNQLEAQKSVKILFGHNDSDCRHITTTRPSPLALFPFCYSPIHVVAIMNICIIQRHMLCHLTPSFAPKSVFQVFHRHLDVQLFVPHLVLNLVNIFISLYFHFGIKIDNQVAHLFLAQLDG